MYLSKEQDLFFKAQLLVSINDLEMVLPNNVHVGQIYVSKSYKYENRGYRELRFFVFVLKNKLFLDYFFVTDDYSIHNRIDELGNTTKLENYIGQFGWPVFDNDLETQAEHQRIIEHNNKVQAILKLKGFVD